MVCVFAMVDEFALSSFIIQPQLPLRRFPFLRFNDALRAVVIDDPSLNAPVPNKVLIVYLGFNSWSTAVKSSECCCME